VGVASPGWRVIAGVPGYGRPVVVAKAEREIELEWLQVAAVVVVPAMRFTTWRAGTSGSRAGLAASAVVLAVASTPSSSWSNVFSGSATCDTDESDQPV